MSTRDILFVTLRCMYLCKSSILFVKRAAPRDCVNIFKTEFYFCLLMNFPYFLNFVQYRVMSQSAKTCRILNCRAGAVPGRDRADCGDLVTL